MSLSLADGTELRGRCSPSTICIWFQKKIPVRSSTRNTAFKGLVAHKTYRESCIEDAKMLCKEGGFKEDLGILPREIRVNSSTYSFLLQECVNMKALAQGKTIHAHMIKCGFELDTVLRNHLVNTYAKCQSVFDACQVFDNMSERDVVSWTTLIAGYAQNGYGEEALILFCNMCEAGITPNSFTYGSILTACASLGDLEQGKQVHAHVMKYGLDSDTCVGNALCTMFAKCESMEYALQVFDKMPEKNVISWTAMIARYVEIGDGEEAFKFYCLMRLAGVKPNHYTFTSVLSACGCLAVMEKGKQVHAHAVKTGFESVVSVENSLIDMYAKCGSIEHARQVFDRMHKRNLVSWNGMIAGYTQARYSYKDFNFFCHGEEALKLLSKMQREGMKLDFFTFASVLTACASLAALEQGKQIHTHVIKTGLESDVSVASALVTMYAKVGSIEGAHTVFSQMTERNVVSWTAMITGYAQHGKAKDALQLFEEMKLAGVKANHITFIGVLFACSHVGLVHEGQRYYNSMIKDHGIMPSMDHYACMVDLFGRAGHLDEAVRIINKMAFEPGALVWRTLLGACRIHGNIDLAKHAAECLLELEPEDDATYVLLSNVYAAAGKWDDVVKVRKMMKDRGVIKEQGRSWIVVKNKVHTFVVRDKSHPETEKIYAKLDKLIVQLEEAGYVPNTNFVLHDVEEEQKELFLSYHSEKLAIAFGVINTPHGMPIRIVKNLRVCGDCHNFIKFISKIVGRKIVVKKAKCSARHEDNIESKSENGCASIHTGYLRTEKRQEHTDISNACSANSSTLLGSD
eukprot:Gb_31374 [translate_table: standard]